MVASSGVGPSAASDPASAESPARDLPWLAVPAGQALGSSGRDRACAYASPRYRTGHDASRPWRAVERADRVGAAARSGSSLPGLPILGLHGGTATPAPGGAGRPSNNHDRRSLRSLVSGRGSSPPAGPGRVRCRRTSPASPIARKGRTTVGHTKRDTPRTPGRTGAPTMGKQHQHDNNTGGSDGSDARDRRSGQSCDGALFTARPLLGHAPPGRWQQALPGPQPTDPRKDTPVCSHTGQTAIRDSTP